MSISTVSCVVFSSKTFGLMNPASLSLHGSVGGQVYDPFTRNGAFTLYWIISRMSLDGSYLNWWCFLQVGTTDSVMGLPKDLTRRLLKEAI